MATTCSRTLLFLIVASASTALGQTAVSVPPIAPTVSLGDPDRTVNLDTGNTTYKNGFFITRKGLDEVSITDKEGHGSGYLTLSAPDKDAFIPSEFISDFALFKDGSIVASWTYMLRDEAKRYFYLTHYDAGGKLIGQIDLGPWRASKICIAQDNSIWALSSQNVDGNPVYSPDEGVLRNYKFGSGFVRAAARGSNFAQDGEAYASRDTIDAAIDCSGNKIHALAGDGQWISYTPGGDFTLTKVEPLNEYAMYGFAYLDENHIYGFMKSGPGYSVPSMLAELLPAKDGKGLEWVELPPDKTLPENQPASAADAGPAKAPVVVTKLLGADHANGEHLVYQVSTDSANPTPQNSVLFWSKPLFATAPSHAE